MRRSLVFVLLVVFLAAPAARVAAHPEEPGTPSKPAEPLYNPALPMTPVVDEPCLAGRAGPYTCDSVDLLSFTPNSALEGQNANDLWGWTDPLSAREYVIMGWTGGTLFVDITEPTDPIYLGNLPTRTSASQWRDVKVIDDHVISVSEAPGHGLQIFDLTRLRGLTGPPRTFEETAHYGWFGHAHNVVANEDTGYAYVVGSSSCSGGLHMVDLRTPTAPSFAGCFSGDGYTHDAQCVLYRGPDPDHRGDELCFASNEDTVTIVDVTNKLEPVVVSRSSYRGVGYTHQGWLTEDHRYFLVDDELDEVLQDAPTATYVWDVTDLDDPRVTGVYRADVASSDHNQYVAGDRSYQANYRSGLRILDLHRVAAGVLTEVGFFDIDPTSDARGFAGAWSVYPYFESGSIAVSGIEHGLFVLSAHESPPEALVFDIGLRAPTTR